MTSGSLSTQDSGGAHPPCLRRGAGDLPRGGGAAHRRAGRIDHASRTAPSTARPGRSAATGNWPTRRCWRREATPEASAEADRGAPHRRHLGRPHRPAGQGVRRARATCTTCACRGCCRRGWCGRRRARAVLAALRDGPLPGDARVVRDGSFLAVLAATEWDAEAAATRVAGARRLGRAGHAAGAGVAGRLAARCRDPRRAQRCGARTATAGARRAHAGAQLLPALSRACLDRAVLRRRALGGRHGHRLDPQPGPLQPARRPRQGAALRAGRRSSSATCEGAGCYGHNGADDVALDAVLAARAVPGMPVRMLWSRAEELGWSPFSPAMLVDVEADLDAAGDIAGLAQPHHQQRPFLAPRTGAGADAALGLDAGRALPGEAQHQPADGRRRRRAAQRRAAVPLPGDAGGDDAAAGDAGAHLGAARPRRHDQCLGDREPAGRGRGAGRRGSAGIPPAPPGRPARRRRAGARRRHVQLARAAAAGGLGPAASASPATRTPAPGPRWWPRSRRASGSSAAGSGSPATWGRW